MSPLVRRASVMYVVASAIAGCSSPPTQSVVQTDVIAYRELLDDIVAATVHYRAVMMDAGMTAGTCGQFHSTYDAQMRWYLGQMPDLAAEMDAAMTDHQAAEAADVECITTAMSSEMDQHASVACSWSDLASDRSEAARHVDAMLALTTHATARCDEIQGGLDGHGWGSGDTTVSCDGGEAGH